VCATPDTKYPRRSARVMARRSSTQTTARRRGGREGVISCERVVRDFSRTRAVRDSRTRCVVGFGLRGSGDSSIDRTRGWRLIDCARACAWCPRRELAGGVLGWWWCRRRRRCRSVVLSGWCCVCDATRGGRNVEECEETVERHWATSGKRNYSVGGVCTGWVEW